MIYKFRSKAAGDLIMLGPHGDQVLRILGREPAPQGILEPQAMPQALQALERAVVQDEAQRQAAAQQPAPPAEPGAPAPVVSLRQRVWPLIDMIRRAHAAGEPIVWGV